jgi:ribosomal protein L7Ae-like RNA K-turn-binding protein
MSRLLGLLGLGLRGGNLIVGVDGVRTALQAGKCRMVVVAADASPRAREKVGRLAERQGTPVVTGPTAEMLGSQLGRPPVMAVGVRDAALARGLLQAAAGQV